jgi:hypothetical protein
MARRRRGALVAFFEVRDEDGDALAEPVDWPGFLAYVSRQSMDNRCHSVNDAPHWGQVYTYNETDHLILARRRDEVSSLNITTGEIVDTESDASNPWVEVSVVHFLPNTNRFGFVLGSNAAPRVTSLQHWINQHNILDEQISVAPVLDRKVLQKIRGADAASMVRVTFDPDRLADIHAHGLYEVAQGLKQNFGDVVIELQLSVTRSHGGRDEQAMMLREARNLAGTGAFDKAVARLLWHDDGGKIYQDDVNFLNHRLARKMKIDLTDKEGKSIRIHSAIDAIYRASDYLKRDLYELPD